MFSVPKNHDESMVSLPPMEKNVWKSALIIHSANVAGAESLLAG
jgi:hypothetical protein